MADPFLAEIRIFTGNYAPSGWAMCDGQLLPLLQNVALFSLLGTTYGGNGSTNFALPDLRGRAPLHEGQGPGLTNRPLGGSGGEEQVTLTDNTLPAHGHNLYAVNGAADSTQPQGRLPARTREDAYTQAGQLNAMSSATVGVSGSSQGHNNMQPYLTLNFIIALQGVYPEHP